MKRALKLIAVTLGIVVLSFFALCSYEHRPSVVFRRVVADPIPASVRNIQVSGATGLAGSDQIVSFELSPEDFPKILARHAFTQKRPEELFLRDTMLRPDFLPLDSPTFFEALEMNGLVIFTIKTNASRTFVFYRYVKI
jgi:hypothetical protein